MRKNPFSWEEHEKFGRAIATFRHPTLDDFGIQLSWRYGKSSPEAHAARR